MPRRHTEAALVRKLALAREAHAEVVVELVVIRGYVQSVSPTGSHLTLWDGESDLEVPMGRIANVRSPNGEEDGARVPTPPRPTGHKPMAEQTALDFSNEQLGFSV